MMFRLAAKLRSLSARRAWIEIIQKIAHLCLKPVALRKESVDRNTSLSWSGETTAGIVALRKESVDRNFDIRYTTSTHPRSLSARRAWIEIG